MRLFCNKAQGSKSLLFRAIVFLAVLTSVQESLATHIRAGEITIQADPSDPYLFTFTFTGIRDRGSPVEFGDGQAYFEFGDDTTMPVARASFSKTSISADIEKVVCIVTHRYSGPGRYTVSYTEQNRNEGILNMSESVNTSFYVETHFIIDPFIGENKYPVLTVPPIDFAAIGALFIHNPGAFDEDGDSLAYKFVVPKQARNWEVNDYRPLNAEEFYSNYAQGSQELTPPTLSLNSLTGDLIWNAPGDAIREGVREYNVAFIVEEWRNKDGKWFLISYVTRDMQIIVEETDNERPELEVPDDICVEAGDTVDVIIQGTDPDNHQVKLEAFGGPFEVPFPATYTPNPPEFRDPPALLGFEWKTACGHVRLRPYEVQFKVTDNPDTPPSLVNFETFEITVVGPAPTGLTTTLNPGRSMQLNWDGYSCPNADTMQIWRRVGSYEVMTDDCVIGMPANTGYELVTKVPISQTSWLDTNNGQGLAPGANYCYRLVAKFSSTAGDALSYVSEEACDSLVLDAPAITHVDVLTTSETNGEILIRWVPPYQVDPVAFPPAYTYDLYRGEGQEAATSYVRIAEGLSDTVFTDTGLNTMDLSYHYFVRFKDSGGVIGDSSVIASSVRLELRPLVKAIEVSWSAHVPWSMRSREFPYHYIYRNKAGADPDELELIDSVNVSRSSFTYLDDGTHNGTPLDEDEEYCYYVATFGSYDNMLLPEPLVNRSQISCAQPNDTIPPCSPLQLTLANLEDCETVVSTLSCSAEYYSNALEWTVDEDAVCGDDIIYYNIYFSGTGNEEDYELIDTSFGTGYIHDLLPSFKGCYRISAVDRSKNESELSEAVCNDNCPVYIFPNVFTPNDDGKNDVFGPKHNAGLNIPDFENSECPRFVRSVIFTVFDRSGNEVYRYDSFENPEGIYINWDGKNNVGAELPAGVYYYVADVVFDVLNPSEARQTLNGWVQLLK